MGSASGRHPVSTRTTPPSSTTMKDRKAKVTGSGPGHPRGQLDRLDDANDVPVRPPVRIPLEVRGGALIPLRDAGPTASPDVQRRATQTAATRHTLLVGEIDSDGH